MSIQTTGLITQSQAPDLHLSWTDESNSQLILKMLSAASGSFEVYIDVDSIDELIADLQQMKGES